MIKVGSQNEKQRSSKLSVENINLTQQRKDLRITTGRDKLELEDKVKYQRLYINKRDLYSCNDQPRTEIKSVMRDVTVEEIKKYEKREVARRWH